MSKRVISLVVLFSLVLHFSSRTGLLDYAYARRHAVAQLLGLIAERPIAECSSLYAPDSKLLQSTAAEHESAPPVLIRAGDVNFVLTTVKTVPAPEYFLFYTTARHHYVLGDYESPLQSLYRPPRS